AYPQVVFTHANVPDDLVYQMTKVLYESKDVMAKTFPSFNNFNPDDMVGEMAPSEYHPGASGFYKEVGRRGGSRTRLSDVLAGKAGLGLPPAAWRPVASVLAICLALVAVLWSLNVPRARGLAFYPRPFLALIPARGMRLARLVRPFRRGEQRD